MNLLLLKTPEHITFKKLENYLSYVSEDRRDKILRFTMESVRIESLLAALLVRFGIQQDLGLSNSKIRIKKEEYGKPYLIGYPNYHFSLSHSGGYIAFVCASQPVGVDIEEMKKPHHDIANRFFTKTESTYVTEHGIEGFYEIWTKKEAYVKLLGTGFKTSISSFDVLTDVPAYFHTQKLEDYCLTVASVTPFPEKTILRRLSLSEVLASFTISQNDEENANLFAFDDRM